MGRDFSDGSRNPGRLERWLRQECLSAKYDEHPITKFTVCHVPLRGSPNQVFEYAVADEPTADDIPTLKDLLWSTIEQDAEGMGGRQKYLVLVWRRDFDSPTARWTGQIHTPEVETDSDPMDTEPASGHGMIAQSMRHTEAIMKTSMGSIGVVMGTMQRMMMQLAEHNERLTQKQFDMFEMLEAARSLQHEREMAEMVAASGEARKDKVFEQLMTLTPVLVNKVGGRKLLPSAKSPTEMMLMTLVHTLEPNQFEGIIKHLKPEQAVLLMDLIKTYQEEEEAKKAAAGDTTEKRNGHAGA